jgi:hypothetical protein
MAVRKELQNTTIEVVGEILPWITPKRRKVLVKCPNCFTVFETRSDSIRAGGVRQITHCYSCTKKNIGWVGDGLTKQYKHLYTKYTSMLSRCYSKDNDRYPHYGGKGVTVCNEWRESFKAFVSWAITKGYTEDKHKTLQLDKDILCSKFNISPAIYSPNTCSFVSICDNNAAKYKKENTSTTYIGVSKHKASGTFIAELSYEGKRLLRKYAKTAYDAAKIREEYIIEHNLPHTRNFNGRGRD